MPVDRNMTVCFGKDGKYTTSNDKQIISQGSYTISDDGTEISQTSKTPEENDTVVPGKMLLLNETSLNIIAEDVTLYFKKS
jgi:hypothetical protein